MTDLVEDVMRAIGIHAHRCDLLAYQAQEAAARAAISVICKALREPSGEMITVLWNVYDIPSDYHKAALRALADYLDGKP